VYMSMIIAQKSISKAPFFVDLNAKISITTSGNTLNTQLENSLLSNAFTIQIQQCHSSEMHKSPVDPSPRQIKKSKRTCGVETD